MSTFRTAIDGAIKSWLLHLIFFLALPRLILLNARVDTQGDRRHRLLVVFGVLAELADNGLLIEKRAMVATAPMKIAIETRVVSLVYPKVAYDSPCAHLGHKVGPLLTEFRDLETRAIVACGP